MSWRKEHREHPWTTPAQAKRIAHDHHESKEHKRLPQKGHTGLFHQKVPLQYTPEFLSKLKQAETKAHGLPTKKGVP